MREHFETDIVVSIKSRLPFGVPTVFAVHQEILTVGIAWLHIRQQYRVDEKKTHQIPFLETSKLAIIHHVAVRDSVQIDGLHMITEFAFYSPIKCIIENSVHPINGHCSSGTTFSSLALVLPKYDDLCSLDG